MYCSFWNKRLTSTDGWTNLTRRPLPCLLSKSFFFERPIQNQSLQLSELHKKKIWDPEVSGVFNVLWKSMEPRGRWSISNWLQFRNLIKINQPQESCCCEIIYNVKRFRGTRRVSADEIQKWLSSHGVYTIQHCYESALKIQLLFVLASYLKWYIVEHSI